MTRSISQLEALLLDLPHISGEVKEGIRQLANDAKRYQWLRGEVEGPHIPMAQVVWKSQWIRDSGNWTNLIDGKSLDEHIDAAIGGNAE